ncbi:MAG: hypothetical protein FWF05_01560 [Oscillospiraceae bacterium]|nr:hypothetical protein [Oscillospiraceae bacterium]
MIAMDGERFEKNADEISVEEILSDIKERSKKYQLDQDGGELNGIDSLLSFGAAAGFSDYEGDGDKDALVFVPRILDADEFSVPEEPIEAERFDDPDFSERYLGEGVFDEYVREVRERREAASIEAGAEEAHFREVYDEETKSADGPVGAAEAKPKSAPIKTAAFNLKGMENSEQRQRFMQVLEPQKPFEYDPKKDNSPIERSGRIFEGGGFDPAAGLEMSPKIYFAEDLLRKKDEKTIVIDGRPGDKIKVKNEPEENTPEIVDGQIVLRGFHEEQETPRVSEAEVESELGEKRREKAKKFKLYDFAEKYEPDLPKQFDMDAEREEVPGDRAYADDGAGSRDEDDIDDEEDEGEDDGRERGKARGAFDASEYHSFGDRVKLGGFLQKEKRNALLTVFGLLAAEAALIVISVLASGGERNLDILYGGALVLTATALAMCLSTVTAGYKALFKLKPNCDSAASLSVTAALAHAAVVFLDPQAEGVAGVYCAAAVFSLLLNQASKLLQKSNTLRNFKYCAFTHHDKLHAIQGFEKKNESFEIGRNLLLGDPELRFSCRAKFPANFIKNASTITPVDRICQKVLPAALGVSLLMALAGWLKTGAGLGALTAFTGAICVSMPAGAGLAVSLPMFLTTRRLTDGGGMLASAEAAAVCGKINALVIDSADLYDHDRCEMAGFKDFKAVRIDDVFLYAASMIVSSGGPLSKAFERIVGSQDILPPAKSLKFEEKLGLSAWIHGQKVLLGNRNLLINHSIEAPPKSAEMRYMAQGRRVLYIAIDNKLTAMFVVEYAEREDLEPYLRAVEESGINLLVSSMDSNITEDFINEGFGLTSGCVRIMSPTAEILFKENRQQEKPAADCAVMHDGRIESLLNCVASASSVSGIARVAALGEIVGAVIGILMLFALLMVRGAAGIGVLPVTVFIMAWTAICTAVGIPKSRR